jgi:hypothetical protein
MINLLLILKSGDSRAGIAIGWGLVDKIPDFVNREMRPKMGRAKACIAKPLPFD